MSLGRRAYNLLRGYVQTEWDRIKDVEREAAERELRDTPTAGPPQPSQPVLPQQPQDQKAYARRLLGVEENSSYEDIRKAFARLNKRSDPSNFPPDSVEARKAADIQRQVNWAYNLLTEDMDATERRFRSLELD